MPVRFYSGSVRLGDPVSPLWTASVFAESGRLDTAEVVARLGALREFLSSGFERSLIAIGEPPPEPPSLRGRVGRLSILILRKLFWWYTRSLVTFGDAVSQQLHDETALLTAMVRLQEEQCAAIASLRAEVLRLHENVLAASRKGPQ